MKSAFYHRFERFTPRAQVALGVLAFALALSTGMVLPLPPVANLIVTLAVLAPLSILLVVAIASRVQQARNIVAESRVEAHIKAGTSAPESHATGPRPDPAWEVALERIAAQERHVRMMGRARSRVMLHEGDRPGGVIVPASLRKADAAAFQAQIERLRQLNRQHPSIATVEALHDCENVIHMLVGKAETGIDIDALNACVELDREFQVFGDCRYGHWDNHAMETVFTAKGGQRRVQRICLCGSRWSEKI